MSLLSGNDLPKTWDGEAVEWEGWAFVPSTLRLHVREAVCHRCGSDKTPTLNVGRTQPKPRGPIVLRLMAFRCPDCRKDHVQDLSDHSWWDLEDEDYR